MEKRYSGGFLKTLINLIVTFLFGIGYFYVKLPAINLHDQNFYFFFFMCAAVYCVISIITSGIWKLRDDADFWPSIKVHCGIPLAICIFFLVFILIGNLLSSVIFRANAYSELLPFTTGVFEDDISEVSYNQIPMLDKDSAERLGIRKLGELSDMVSQFEVSSNNTQINIDGKPVRVAPLKYGDFFKWLNNHSEGLPAYIEIDMVTQNVEVVRLEEGMKYSDTDLFFRYLPRYIRFRYPTYIFETPTFEVDDEGTPYWICSRVVKRIGLFGGKDISGAVLVNAVTGESKYYESDEIPSWVDRVYSADLIISQYDYYGQYHNGLINSMFGQKDVTITTDGYNYLAIDDDVYVYTGVTSVSGDESNVGFILTNQRTKETTFYKVAGAEEYSAMESAEGVVQHLGYSSTFPLLLNINNEPTYFMSLKDAAGLVKMYAMVNVEQYQIVATGNTVAECQKSYLQLLEQNHIVSETTTEDTAQIEGIIENKLEAVLDGNTWYYFKLDNQEGYYSISAADCETAVILGIGDKVTITYDQNGNNNIYQAETVE